MGMAFEELEKQARSLGREEKATLARILIEELDTAIDPNAEQLWLEEAQRRYESFLKAELEAHPGDEIMQRASDRLRSPAERGYLYFKIAPGKEEITRKEWADLKAVAGTGQGIGFAQYWVPNANDPSGNPHNALEVHVHKSGDSV